MSIYTITVPLSAVLKKRKPQNKNRSFLNFIKLISQFANDETQLPLKCFYSKQSFAWSFNSTSSLFVVEKGVLAY